MNEVGERRQHDRVVSGGGSDDVGVGGVDQGGHRVDVDGEDTER